MIDEGADFFLCSPSDQLSLVIYIKYIWQVCTRARRRRKQRLILFKRANIFLPSYLRLWENRLWTIDSLKSGQQHSGRGQNSLFLLRWGPRGLEANCENLNFCGTKRFHFTETRRIVEFHASVHPQHILCCWHTTHIHTHSPGTQHLPWHNGSLCQARPCAFVPTNTYTTHTQTRHVAHARELQSE